MSCFKSGTMQHMSLFMLKDDVPMASVILASREAFDLSRANHSNQFLPERYGEDYTQEFEHALGRCKKIVSFIDIRLNNQVSEIAQISFKKLTETNNRLGEIWHKCIRFQEQKRQLSEKKRLIKNLRKLLHNFSVFDVDLSFLIEKIYFLDIELGIMPSGHVTRLKKSLALDGFYLTEYMNHDGYAHVVIAGMKENRDKIQSLLYSANFQKIPIPVEFYDHPKNVLEKINQLDSQYQAEQQHYRQNFLIFRSQYAEEIKRLGDVLTLAKPYTLMSQQMQGKGVLINVNGWVLASEVQSMEKQLQDALNHRVIINIRRPTPEEYSATPSHIKHSHWISPFIKLMKHYGMPRYNEFDPGWFFTVSYVLMFGIMFGDVGHGLCLMAISFWLRKKWSDAALFLGVVGFSSMLFGFIYGSIFCYEHIIPALWMSPLSDPVLMLQIAVWWGVGFIIVLNLFSIYNRISALQLGNALFDERGVSGLVMYCSMIWIAYQLSHDSFMMGYWLLLLIPLFLIGVNKWYKSNATHGERLLIIVIESYELIVNYLANTISFLRLAAFSLNHVALAVSVFTMASMVDGAGHWLVILLGNLFILLLEGAVVGIQTLRLEYYEGFSRFFYADGYPFEPLNLSPKKL